MSDIFMIDGVSLRINIIELERGFAVLDTQNSGRTISGEMHRDIIGTYYNYTLQIEPDISYRADYDTLYEIVSSPVESHTMTFPYAQESLTFKAYVTQGNDKYKKCVGRDGAEKNVWSGLSLKFDAMEPQRRPG